MREVLGQEGRDYQIVRYSWVADDEISETSGVTIEMRSKVEGGGGGQEKRRLAKLPVGEL